MRIERAGVPTGILVLALATSTTWAGGSLEITGDRRLFAQRILMA